ncbi:hypothetical protein C8R43DRAFT_150711 [Mycena crocata]|nr:hypothetical protein C8R43DRAFT_150711 [Mycena crocata]
MAVQMDAPRRRPRSSNHRPRQPPFLHFMMEDWGDDSGHVEQFFQPFSLPMLEWLDLRLALKPLTPEFSQFLLRSPSIRSLSLSNSNLSSEELICIVRAAPTITSLNLAFCDLCFDDNFLHALRHRKPTQTDANPLAPMLERFMWEETKRDFEETLEDMIRSRWWPAGQSPPQPRITRLKSGCLSGYRPSDAFIARMHDCIADGISIC